jgi:NAD(P)-dependent dehydrogenase (short-subunit alcohol dehydrogenase family)
MEIKGAAALVSGGASGLGEATSRVLAGAGATVVIADLNADKGKALADELKGVFVETNVADEESVANAVAAALDTGLPLRMGISCAGIGWASRCSASLVASLIFSFLAMQAGYPDYLGGMRRAPSSRNTSPLK